MVRNVLLILLITCLVLAAGSALAKKADDARTIHPLEAQQMLMAEPKNTFMLDVRTRAEYALQGHVPKAYNVPWRLGTSDFQIKGGPYQGEKVADTGYQLSVKPNPDFVGVVKSLFKPDDKIIVISTQGDQGAEAADALVKAGYKNVFNVDSGFLGHKLTSDKEQELAAKFSPYYGQRGRLDGWVYWGLPVQFELDPRYIYPPDLKRMQKMK